MLLAVPVLAQNNTGIISGRVTDASGAVIPNAQITVTQTETNVDAVSATNSDGLFRVPSLINGPYKVTITAAGFKKQVRDGLTLRIGENLNVEIKLDVGSVSESVEVTSALPLLETQTSSTGQVMEGDYFYKLPNYQHWSKGVLYYTPQVGSTNAPWPGSLGNWNINGGQTYQTAQYEDGIMATSMDGGTTLNSVVVGIEEVKVLTSAMPAEYGHATSGALIIVKKAGTNTLHGEGGELFKSTSMMHRRFFQRTTLQQDNPDNHTLFQMPDFVVSGPVYHPQTLQRQEQDVLRGRRVVPHRQLVEFWQLYDSYARNAGGQLQRLLQPDLRSELDLRQFRGGQPVAHARSPATSFPPTASARCGTRLPPTTPSSSPGGRRQHHQYRPERKHRRIGHRQLL